MASFKSNSEAHDLDVMVPGGGTRTVKVGKSGHLTPGVGETRVLCPKCGSPYLASFSKDESRFGASISGFTCTAGDCGYSGSARRA
jgi:hypothetical protein